MFVRPRDREVECHASAWDIDDRDDLRIKMCFRVNAEDFYTIHHELADACHRIGQGFHPRFDGTGRNRRG